MIRYAVLRLFFAICSYIERRQPGRCPGVRTARVPTSELDLGHLASGLLGLEVLALLVLHRAGHHDGRERLDLGFVLQDAVVVELPRVRHSALGRRELYLQAEEALVGIEVRIS